MTPSLASDEFVEHFDIVASALSGRMMRVVKGASSESGWTDGNLIHIDASLSEQRQVASIAVQASLVSAGALDPSILRKLTHRPKATARYLTIEGHRALKANEALLPPSPRLCIDEQTAARSTSADQSLTIALSDEPVPDPPFDFGMLRPRQVIATTKKTGGGEPADRRSLPRRLSDELNELDDDDDFDEDGAGAAADMLSVGGASGVLGRLLQRFLKGSRRGEGGGTPGTDSPTHIGRGIAPRRGAAVLSHATVAPAENVETNDHGTKYPEWDTRRKAYRQDWCTVEEFDPPTGDVDWAPVPDSVLLRKHLVRLGLDLAPSRRRSSGDDIDIDAAIDSYIQVRASSTPNENVYVDLLHRRRDLSVLVLLDISGSAGESDGYGSTVHERQCSAAASICSTLSALGDRVGLYAYNSQGRTTVNLFPVLEFDDRFNAETMRRLRSLAPGAYSRLGSAIRHGSAVLAVRGGTFRRLLLVLSDGVAYDHGYDKDYGAADTRRALAETRRGGTGALCLTFGNSADGRALKQVFGTSSHASVSTQARMAEAVGALAHRALRSADVRRRVT
jgi:nitric oxide reductase NorD protein